MSVTRFADIIGHFTMRRATHHKFALFLALVALFSPLTSRATQIDSTYGPLPVFELHSGFWINLHHTLYEEARQRSTAPAARTNSPAVNPAKPVLKTAPSAKAALTPVEQHAWDDAVSFYAANYAGKDLLFSSELILLQNQLGDFEDCDELSGARKQTCDAGLPPDITRVLDGAAPVYRAHQWPAHDRANRAWIARVAPLVREQGLGLSQRLADIYQTKWPAEKIRVDVTDYANWAGAYTTLDPLRVTISGTDPRNQGSAALEVLFHEASHGIAEPVQQAIIRECHQREKAIPRDLWHALIFYTTGEVIKPVINGDANQPPATSSSQSPHGAQPLQAPQSSRSQSSDDAYVPYAVRAGLYSRGWNEYLSLLTRFWQPYLDGRVTFSDAIAHIVSAL
ncbi:MAG TPA: hypothetical protein VGI16_08800 [Candidatus Acidoferrum sp.]